MMVQSGGLPPMFKELNYKSELEDLNTIETKISEIANLMKPKRADKLVYPLIAHLETLERYIKWMNHPVYLNEYKDKYGNKYLQARTSIKDENGKTNWINAYIGTISDYPDGVNDLAALDKAKPLIRKKLKKYFGI